MIRSKLDSNVNVCVRVSERIGVGLGKKRLWFICKKICHHNLFICKKVSHYNL